MDPIKNAPVEVKAIAVRPTVEPFALRVTGAALQAVQFEDTKANNTWDTLEAAAQNVARLYAKITTNGATTHVLLELHDAVARLDEADYARNSLAPRWRGCFNHNRAWAHGHTFWRPREFLRWQITVLRNELVEAGVKMEELPDIAMDCTTWLNTAKTMGVG